MIAQSLTADEHAFMTRIQALPDYQPKEPRAARRRPYRHASPGRHPREENYAAKLTMAAVTEIRARYAAGGVTLRELGREFGITRQHAGFLASGRGWA